jgi:CO/xanthine dehydrogenase Mo-binding subunit
MCRPEKVWTAPIPGGALFRRCDRGLGTLRGRGIAYAQRSGAVVAIVAEVEIDRHSGKVWARKFTVAHDCGLIINPDGLKRCTCRARAAPCPRRSPLTAPR